jgi:hypothetical protein
VSEEREKINTMMMFEEKQMMMLNGCSTETKEM